MRSELENQLSGIVSETCEALYQCLKERYLSKPHSSEDWLQIAESFETIWNMPHVLGSIDGKHIRIECPKLSGTLYHNYKGFFSIVLLAVCDANYCFSMFDLGQYGSNNDSGVLVHSNIGQMFDEDLMNVPEDSKLPGCEADYLPYYLLGDEIFPLKKWLLRPYPGRMMTEEQKIYNYRHSRARRAIENAFGILAAKWRIFQTPIRAAVDNVEKYTAACLALHNYLRLTDNAHYCPAGFVDSVDQYGNIKEGEWRAMQENQEANTGGMLPIAPIRNRRYSDDAVGMRDVLKDYLNSEEGSVPWQVDYVRRSSHYASQF